MDEERIPPSMASNEGASVLTQRARPTRPLTQSAAGPKIEMGSAAAFEPTSQTIISYSLPFAWALTFSLMAFIFILISAYMGHLFTLAGIEKAQEKHSPPPTQTTQRRKPEPATGLTAKNLTAEAAPAPLPSAMQPGQEPKQAVGPVEVTMPELGPLLELKFSEQAQVLKEQHRDLREVVAQQRESLTVAKHFYTANMALLEDVKQELARHRNELKLAQDLIKQMQGSMKNVPEDERALLADLSSQLSSQLDLRLRALELHEARFSQINTNLQQMTEAIRSKVLHPEEVKMIKGFGETIPPPRE
jgi:hypothetical protein